MTMDWSNKRKIEYMVFFRSEESLFLSMERVVSVALGDEKKKKKRL